MTSGCCNDWLELIFWIGLPEENIVLMTAGQVQILNIAPFLPPRPAHQAFLYSDNMNNQMDLKYDQITVPRIKKRRMLISTRRMF